MKKAKNTLSSNDLKKFRNLLLEKRSKLLGNIGSMENGVLKKEQDDLSKLPIHMADVGTDNYDQEFTLGLVGSELKLLREINEALERIDVGCYGICEGDNCPIPKARLEAIPWARYCVKCAEKIEKGLIIPNHSKDDDMDGYGYDEDDDTSEDEYYSKRLAK